MNVKRMHRLYYEERLQLTRGRPWRRKGVAARPEPAPTTGPNQQLTVDFVHDVPASGDPVRVLTVVYLHRRECVASAARRRFVSEGVAWRMSGAAARERGVPWVAIQADQ